MPTLSSWGNSEEGLTKPKPVSDDSIRGSSDVPPFANSRPLANIVKEMQEYGIRVVIKQVDGSRNSRQIRPSVVFMGQDEHTYLRNARPTLFQEFARAVTAEKLPVRIQHIRSPRYLPSLRRG